MNNYDTSSSGVDIEVSISRDEFNAQMLFNENFVKVKTDGSSVFHSNYSRVDTWLYVDNGNVDQDNYKKSKVVAIRGYSQGDYVEIIIPINLGFKRGFDFESYFTNLFFDQPITGLITIDNFEIDLNEYLKNEYEYDKNEIINIVKKQCKDHEKLDLIIEFLEENLSEYI